MTTLQKSFDLTTADGCIQQIASAMQTIKRGQSLSDEAMIAYLQMDGKTVKTLWADLQDANCCLALKTLQNRQSDLRRLGLLSAADAAHRRDGNGGHSRTGIDAQIPEPDWQNTDSVSAYVKARLEAKLQKVRDDDAAKKARRAARPQKPVKPVLDNDPRPFNPFDPLLYARRLKDAIPQLLAGDYPEQQMQIRAAIAELQALLD
jgi:hypothetical protein